MAAEHARTLNADPVDIGAVGRPKVRDHCLVLMDFEHGVTAGNLAVLKLHVAFKAPPEDDPRLADRVDLACVGTHDHRQ